MTNWDVNSDLRDRIVLLQEALRRREREIKVLQIKLGKKNEEIERLTEKNRTAEAVIEKGDSIIKKVERMIEREIVPQ